MRPHPTLGLLLVLVVAGCGGSRLSVADYAAGAERLVSDMQADFAVLDAGWEAQTPTQDGALRYWEGRLAIRDRFLAGVEELDPPREIEDMHAAALDIFGRITAADGALAERVARQAEVTGHWDWVDTPEGRASDAILGEVYAFCRASQADFDATRSREAFVDLPWVPSEMTEVVSVAFGCPAG